MDSRFPQGRLCVTTIHQAKGLEWPVVVVGSLDDAAGGDDVGRELDAYSPHPPFEPPWRIPEFDAMRQHYVAFSRARSLLVLTASGPPAPHFSDIWDSLPRWPHLDAAERDRLLRQRFAPAEPGDAPAASPNLVIPRVKRLVVRPAVPRPASVQPGRASPREAHGCRARPDPGLPSRNSPPRRGAANAER